MRNFTTGQAVRCVKTWTTYVIDAGRDYVLQDVDTVAGYVQVMGTWVPDDHFEPIAPALRHELLLGRLSSLADEWAAMGRDLLLTTESHACERGVSYIAQASTLRRIVEEEES